MGGALHFIKFSSSKDPGGRSFYEKETGYWASALGLPKHRISGPETPPGQCQGQSPKPPALGCSDGPVSFQVALCTQVALGMEHLSNNRFVHKDLAARNCLVSAQRQVKVSALGLSKDVYNR